MAKAITFIKKYKTVKKGTVMANCSASMAAKLVHKYGVAEYVELQEGTGEKQAAVKASDIVDKAKKEARAIIKKANESAEAIVEGAQKEAQQITNKE